MLTHDKQKHDNEDNHKHHDKQENLQHQIKQIHGTVMIVTWFALLQLAVWSHYFRSYRYSIVVHIVCVTLICALSLLGCVLIIVAQSMEVIWQQFVHQTVGFFLIAAILPITFLLGLTSRLSTNLSSIQIKNIHRIFGWSIFILSKLPLYSGISYEQVTTALYFAILDISLTALFWYLKSKQAKMVTILTNDKFNEIYHKNNHKGECSSLMQYKQRFNNKCFIFANYLYQIEPLLNYHPGGQYLISNVRNRQVDRFIYGMQSLQTVHNIKPHSHSKNCLNLAYKPICKINIPQVYIQIPNKTICSIVNAYENIQSHMLIVYLKLSLCTLNNGYTSVTQLGRYRALLVNGVTRLYSCVEFLRPSNVRFMEKIIKQTSNNSYSKIQIKSKVENRSVIEMEQKFINQNQLSEDSPLLPLFIKKYPDGQFTQFLLQKLMNSNIQQNKSYITQTRGFGLGLNAFIQDSHKQRIVMFAGGTGLNPYCDMIDLLFKQMLIATKQQGWQNIFKQNITLQQNQLNKYEIILYIAVNSLSYIHPITLFQLQSLSKNGLITVYIKSKQAISSQLTLSSLKYVNKLPIYFRFQSAIQKQLNNDRNTQFLVCGTNSMVKNLVEKLQQFGVQEHKYRII